MRSDERPNSGWRGRLHEIIFEADTPAGKAFDLTVIGAILLSVAVVMLESVSNIRARFGHELYILEWVFTILFSIEYLLRVVAVRTPLRYMGSFFGIVDLLAVLPTYISLVVPGSQYLLTIRILRLLRIFRILKLTHYLTEAGVITSALRASRRKILVFLLGVLTLATIVGTLIYVVEGEKHGFTDIPTSIYWAIVTLTTVGYGDLSPQTPAGKFLASIVMIMGYGIIAVPTGIVTVELGKAANKPVSTQACPACGVDGHEHDATFCRVCGERL